MRGRDRALAVLLLLAAAGMAFLLGRAQGQAAGRFPSAGGPGPIADPVAGGPRAFPAPGCQSLRGCGGVIAGRVLRAGTPFPGARVAYATCMRVGVLRVDLADETVSDDRGAFEFRGVQAGTCIVFADARGGLRSAARSFDMEPGGWHEDDLALCGGAAITGRLLCRRLVRQPMVHVGAGSEDPIEQVRVLHARISVQADGRFWIGGLEHGQSYCISASDAAGGWGSEAVEAPAQGVEISLEVDGRVHLRLTDTAGNLVGGEGVDVRVDLVPEPPPGPHETCRPTGSCIYYQGSGRCRISVCANGYIDTLSEPIDLAAEGEHWVEISLPSGLTVRGTVVGPDGAPLGGCIVGAFYDGRAASDDPAGLASLLGEMFHWPPENRWSGISTVRVGLDGQFSLEGLSPGTHTIVAVHPQHAEGVAVVDVQRDREEPEVTLRLAPGGAIEGVVHPNGPGHLEHGQVEVARGDGRWRTDVAADGRFRVQALSPGEYRVTFLRAWEPTARVTTRLEAGGEAWVGLAAPSDVDVRGRVLLDDRGVAGVDLRWGGAGGRWGEVTTDADGGFTLRALHRGAYRLWATLTPDDFPPYGGERTWLLEVPDQSDWSVTLEIPRAQIVGYVLDASSGEPIEGATVSVVSAPSGRTGEGDAVASTSGWDGLFVLGPLGAGAHCLLVRAAGYLPRQVEGVEAAEGGTRRTPITLDRAPDQCRISTQGDAR